MRTRNEDRSERKKKKDGRSVRQLMEEEELKEGED